LLGLTVVTGTGELVEASAERNPELFWALRGGKGGLGIVTEVRLRLVELRTLYAGSLFHEEGNIEAALRGWVDWTGTADPLVTTSVAIVRFPALEVVPAPLRGRRLLGLRFAYPGSIEQGERLAAPLRAAAPVYLDALGPMAASEIARIHNDPPGPTPAWVSGLLLTHVDQNLASVLLSQLGAGTDAPFIAAEIRHLGEATARDVEGGSAVGGRGAGFTFGLVGIPDPQLFQTVLPAAADRLMAQLRPWTAAETNINLAGEPHTPARFASAWPPDTFARLAALRRQYDPDGVFAPAY
jgi:FAD/FMN-containing dehydrogenase